MSGSIERQHAFANREFAARAKKAAVDLTPESSAAATSRVCALGDMPVTW